MVDLVDDDVVEGVGVEPGQVLGARDEIAVQLGAGAQKPGDVGWAEAVAQEGLEAVGGLAQDLAAVGEEEDAGLAAELVGELGDVEGGEPGLAQSRGEDGEATLDALRAGVCEGGEGGLLDRVGLGRCGDRGVFDLTGG